MGTLAPPLSIRTPRAKLVTGPEHGTMSRVRVVVTDTTLRVFNDEGTLVLEGEVATVEQIGRAKYSAQMSNGETWEWTKAGCGCGG
jgi:hypothetical protein